MDNTAIDLEKTVRLMDAADEIRRQQRRVQEHMEQTDRDKIKAHLMQRYEELGYEADAQLLDEAIETVLAQQYCFRPPRGGFGLTLARIFVRRAELTRKIGVPVVAVTGLAGLVTLGVMVVNEIKLRERERGVEEAVVSLYTENRQLSAEFERIAANPLRGQLPQSELNALDEQLATAGTSLDLAGEFLKNFAPGGVARESVTRQNLAEVAGQTERVEASLEQARDCLAHAADLIRRQAELDRVRLSLENLVAKIRAADAPVVVHGRAQSIYGSGMRSLDGRLLDEAKEHERELLELSENLGDLQLLPAEALAVYERIQSMAEEARALELAEQQYEEAQRHIAAADVSRARAAVAELEEFERTLNLEYTIVISRGRVRDNVRHYLIVRALDPNDRALRMKIRNEETGRVQEVTEWGERVPKSVYDQVERDYTADRVINDNYFGRKLRGYLTPQRRFEDLGQITRW